MSITMNTKTPTDLGDTPITVCKPSRRGRNRQQATRNRERVISWDAVQAISPAFKEEQGAFKKLVKILVDGEA